MSVHAHQHGSAIARLRAQSHEFLRAKPGERFITRYRRRQQQGRNPLLKALWIGGGLVLLAAGLVLMAAPGPGIIVGGIGAALIAEESRAAARVLDWLEVRVRRALARAQKRWKRASMTQKALIGVAGVLVAGAVALAALAVVVD